MSNIARMKRLHKIFFLLSKIFYVLFFICVISLFFSIAIPINRQSIFDKCFVNHVKRGIDSLNLDIAKKELDKAIKYLNDNNLTNGSTSIFSGDSENDLESYYNWIKEVYKYIKYFPSNASKVERLKYFKELENIESTINIPKGMAMYPYNKLFFIWIMLSFIGSILSYLFRHIFIKKDNDIRWDIFAICGENV